MGRTLGRTTAAVAGAAVAGATLAGCHFARPPAGSTTNSTPRPAATASASSGAATVTAATRLADAPALIVQCAVNRAGLRPADQDWFSAGHVAINSTDAANFATWWHAHFTPGPYPQTFTIDGHRTHYLAFGATWVHKHGAWVPTHTALNDPKAQQTSLYAWSLWTAANNRLPAAVCGPSASARQLQTEVYGTSVVNPWGS